MRYGDGLYGIGVYGDRFGTIFEVVSGLPVLLKTTRGPGNDDLILSGSGPFALNIEDTGIAQECWVRAGILEEVV